MSRGFSEQEKKEIKFKLISAFETALKTQTIHKISIDDLIYEAGISKGSFYSFYETKELLFVDVVHHVQNRMKENLYVIIQTEKEEPKKALKNMIKSMYEHLLLNPWILKLTSVENERTMRRLPIEVRNNLIEQDSYDIEEMLNHLGIESSIPVNEISSALRTLLFSIPNKELIGPDFEKGIMLLIDGFIDRVVGDNN
ncbi:TetR/AcrR family transcriptional regulator [Oceanobacillus jeddahense]|uniref:TetR/AcrR family transcriptional regulator n=1 Tax=Oceanobacillus jeddahense TaxID=1462527 RepID=A0ABY5K219_9BACI|nr:TetR/AcrR family transcriptional regulator [Oceanobacillus jeddahense]UUI04809.1 TetR/AcrR family transcriptional regulator [Oceanobacillus jeddahense]